MSIASGVGTGRASVYRVYERMNSEIDIRPILGATQAPNLLRNVRVKAQIEKLDARKDC